MTKWFQLTFKAVSVSKTFETIMLFSFKNLKIENTFYNRFQFNIQHINLNTETKPNKWREPLERLLMRLKLKKKTRKLINMETL
jgi:hypothetical protein